MRIISDHNYFNFETCAELISAMATVHKSRRLKTKSTQITSKNDFESTDSI